MEQGEENKITTEEKGKFPSIKQLFAESWHTCVKSLGKVLLLWLVAFVTSLALMGITAAGVFGFGIKWDASLLSNPNPEGFLKSIQVAQGVWWFLGLMVIVFIAYGLLYQAAMYVIAAEPGVSLGGAIKAGWKRILALFLTGWIVGILTTGASFLLLIPSLIVSFFLMMVPFEVVIGKKSGLKAVRGSARIISQHFGEILAALVVYWAGYVMLFMVLPRLIMRVDAEAGLYFWMVMMVFGLFVGWYGVIYTVNLYKHAEKQTDWHKPVSLWWMWLVSGLGWVLAGLVIFFAWRWVAKNDLLPKMMRYFKEVQQQEEQVGVYVPSSCGLSLPTPTTGDDPSSQGSSGQAGQARRWLYEEYPVQPESFYVLDSVRIGDKVTGAFLGYRSPQQTIGKVNVPGLSIFCAENTGEWSLDEAVTLAKANKKLTIIDQGKDQWGDVEVAVLRVQGKLSGVELNEPGYLAISRDKKQVLYLRLWAPDPEDKMKETLLKDLQLIQKKLKYR